MKFDLHSHSYFSDGSLSPAQLIALAEQSGVTHLALTDHDTLAGLPEAHQAAENSVVNLVNGVEFSCTWNNQLLHVVGLNVDPNHPILKSGIRQNQQRRKERADSMFEDLEQHEIFVRESVERQLAGRGVPTRPHFAQAIVEQGLAKDKKQAFKRYLVRGKPGYIPMLWPSLDDVGEWIHQAGGIAVLAHPLRYKFSRTKLIRLISEMIPAGVRGIEVSTATTDKQQISMLAELCLKFNLLASQGSDFHNHEQPWAKLGAAPTLPNTLTPVWSQF